MFRYMLRLCIIIVARNCLGAMVSDDFDDMAAASPVENTYFNTLHMQQNSLQYLFRYGHTEAIEIVGVFAVSRQFFMSGIGLLPPVATQ